MTNCLVKESRIDKKNCTAYGFVRGCVHEIYTATREYWLHVFRDVFSD